jgi:basic membrane protein A
MRFRIITIAAIFTACTAVAATAPTLAPEAKPSKPKFNPAIVYYLSSAPEEGKQPKTDGAFIDAARIGIDKAATEFKTPIAEHRVMATEDITAAIKRVADSGASPIIALGSQNVLPVLSLAERYPNTQFTVIDGLVPPLFPNVQSILFKDNEGAFLVGLIAARTAKSGKLGFIGGLDSPLIRNFATGFTQGAHHANPAAKVTVSMIGTTADAWNNPAKARELALAQYESGVEVILAAAGGSSLGALKAANESGQYAIGIDTNQNGLFPGRVLTSLVKRVDIAVYDTLKRARDGSWSPGIKYLGIKEGALDYAVDQNNSSLISEKLIEEVATAKERIINGLIVVDTYSPK